MRAYTGEFARRFLGLSKSEGYGVEVEQVVAAFLTEARVETIPLTYSRRRDPYTLTSKYLDSLNAILAHEQALREKGMDTFVDFWDRMRVEMAGSTDVFLLDLRQIEGHNLLEARRVDDKYTLRIKE